MDLQSYISSGILESYVLGLTSPEENREIEVLAGEHAIIREEIASIQASLEAYATQFAQPPPLALEAKILSALDELEAEEKEKVSIPINPFIAVEKTDQEFTGEESDLEDEPNQPPVTLSHDSMSLTEIAQRQNRSKYWAVAASVLLGVSLLVNLLLFSRWKQTESQLAQVTAEQQQLALRNKEMQQQITVVSNPEYKVVNLQTTHPKMNAEVIVYWHPQEGHLYIAASKLPPLPKGKKYQLWAIVGNTPVDAGVFSPTQKDGLLPMKSMPRQAQAFAVTMEDEKGSAVPTMPIYVQANV